MIDRGLMLVLCWPAALICIVISLFLGFYLGRMWQGSRDGHKRDQRQKTVSKEEKREVDVDPEIVPEIVMKTGPKTHRYESLAAKEIMKRHDKGGTLFLSKSCTKVHFLRDCPGLNSADQFQIKAIPICLHCLNYQRKMTKYDREDEGHKEEKGS